MAEKIWGFSKQQVNYKPAPRERVRCDACRFMFPKTAIASDRAAVVSRQTGRL